MRVRMSEAVRLDQALPVIALLCATVVLRLVVAETAQILGTAIAIVVSGIWLGRRLPGARSSRLKVEWKSFALFLLALVGTQIIVWPLLGYASLGACGAVFMVYLAWLANLAERQAQADAA